MNTSWKSFCDDLLWAADGVSVGVAMKFSDQPHFEKLAGYLWAKKGPGAALMVGAGFSRNAVSVSGLGGTFPTWDDLGWLLMDELGGPGQTMPERSTQRVFEGVNTIRLAAEYEAAFGQTALEELLRTAIPDNEFEPGNVHELLLSLPWTDVFTTNYDTLLEKTRPRLAERKYDVVYTTHDIPAAEAPRIVKLHGSFPSTRPWIVTDEHYRRYPMDFAPFVNMVQQAMMENALCLVGFSGDDQNFLYWTGWVRDALGAARLPVYLLTLDVSPSRRAWLERRNVTPIDLGPLFPRNSGDERHRRAMEWVLQSLHANRPEDMNRWPNTETSLPWGQGNESDLPKLAVPRTRVNAPKRPSGRSLSKGEALTPDEVDEIYRYWGWLRQSYPGWVVAPASVRAELIAEIEINADDVLRSIQDFSAERSLAIVRSLNWLLETTLTPLNDDWAPEFEQVLNAIQLPHENFSQQDNHQGYTMTTSKGVAGWVEVAFAMMRYWREVGQREKFEEWCKELEPMVHSNADWLARFNYERALFAVSWSDEVAFSKLLDEWPMDGTAPIWILRYVGLLAHAKRFEDARRRAEQLLTRTRQQLAADPENRFLMSLEGWAMFFLAALIRGPRPFDHNAVARYRDRWDALEAYRCNPWPEFDFFRTKLRSEPPEPLPSKRIQIGFDPGSATISHNLGTGTWRTAVDAFRFLRLIEEVGLPPKIGVMDVAAGPMARAAVWIQPYDPKRALRVLLRSGIKKDVEAFFDRIRVATFTEEEIALIYNLAWPGLAGGIERLDADPPGRRGNEDITRVETNLEVLSRIAFRLDDPQLSMLLEQAVALTRKGWVQREISLYRPLDRVFRRVLYVMRDRHVVEKAGLLLDVPIAGLSEETIPFPEHWPDPFHHVQTSQGEQASTEFDKSALERKVANLTELARASDNLARGHAVFRLSVLLKWGVLTKKQQEAFSKAIWHVTDDVFGLPKLDKFTARGLIALPGGDENQVADKIRQKLLAMEPTPVVRVRRDDGKKRFSASRPIVLYEEEILSASGFPPRTNAEPNLIDWTGEEATRLFAKLKCLWDGQKEGIKWYLGAAFAPGDQRDFWPLVDVLTKVILPRVPPQTALQVVELLNEMDEFGIDVTRGLPLTLLVDPENKGDIVERLLRNLHSLDSEKISSAGFGIYNWGILSFRWHFPPLNRTLLDALVGLAVLRRHPGIDTALNVSGALIRQAPDLFVDEHYRDLLTALAYLKVETSLDSLSSPDQIAVLSPPTELPRLRALACGLARALFDAHGGRLSGDPVIQKWRKIGEGDILPEVRYAWSRVD